jgi:hypothetical protein
MGDFAFVNVQLPPSLSPSQSATEPEKQTGRMAIRAAAMQAVSRVDGLTDIAGMAVCVDLGGKSGWGFDHPVNKGEISRRLALQLVHVAWAKQQEFMPLWTGPVLTSVTKTAATTVTVALEGYSAVGLRLQDVKDCMQCCKAGSPFETTSSYNPSSTAPWTKASATYLGAGSVVLTVPSDTAAIRYAWHDYVECVLVNSVRCAFSDRNLHSRMPLDPTHVRLKLLHACDQWHSSRKFTPLTCLHCKLRPNAQGRPCLKSF